MLKLSIAMMVKNEEKHLYECLESLTPLRKNINSELIVVDTGSTDKTVSIAKKFTDKLYFHKWNNNFSEMRNITIDYCKGEWIFIIDGDEVLEYPDDIISFFKKEKYNNYNTCFLTLKNLASLNDLSKINYLNAPRIFKNSETFKFVGSIHNQPIFKEPYKHFERPRLVHYGYIMDDEELMEKKFNRTSKLLKMELKNNPSNIYYWFQLSVTYSMHKDYGKAISPAETAYNLIFKNRKKIIDYPHIILNLIRVYINNKQFEEGSILIEKYNHIFDNYLDFNYMGGSIKAKTKKYNEAINYYQKYLEIHEIYNTKLYKHDPKVSELSYNLIDEVYKNLGFIYSYLNKYDKSFEFIKKIKSKVNIVSIMKVIITSSIKTKNIKFLRNIYNNTILKESKDVVFLFEKFLENQKLNCNIDEQKRICKEFQNVDTIYSNYNKIIFKNINNEPLKNLTPLIQEIDFYNVTTFYYDLILIAIKNKADLSDIFYLDVDLAHYKIFPVLQKNLKNLKAIQLNISLKKK